MLNRRGLQVGRVLWHTCGIDVSGLLILGVLQVEANEDHHDDYPDDRNNDHCGFSSPRKAGSDCRLPLDMPFCELLDATLNPAMPVPFQPITHREQIAVQEAIVMSSQREKPCFLDVIPLNFCGFDAAPPFSKHILESEDALNPSTLSDFSFDQAARLSSSTAIVFIISKIRSPSSRFASKPVSCPTCPRIIWC
jgi:hypothetical protein